MSYLRLVPDTIEWLESWLRKEFGHPVGMDGHWSVLSRLDPGQLMRLDAALRNRGSDWERTRDNARDVVFRLSRNANPEVALFVLGCNGNGFVREAALHEMRVTPGPVALSLALLRADDHVPQVREAALALLSTLLRKVPAYQLFDHLDLIFALRSRERFSANAWATLEQALLDVPNSEDRWYAARAGSTAVRRYAWKLMAVADADVIDTRLVDAVLDPDPGVAHWALERAKTVADWRDIAHVAASHPQASVRAEVLRLRVARDGVAALPDLEKALFDRAQTVRLTASYLARGHVDAIARWRAAADAAVEPARAIAMSALADLAMREDEPRMVAALSHSLSVVRGGALSALVRIASDDAVERIECAIADSSPRVARIAYRLARKRGLRLPVELLDAQFMQATAAPARARVIANVDLAGKWESLVLLLKWSAAASEGEAPGLKRALRLWLLADARVQSPIPAGTRAPLAAAIERARLAWPRWNEWERLTFSLRTSGG